MSRFAIRYTHTRLLIVGIALLTMLISVNLTRIAAQGEGSTLAADHDGTYALEWMDLLYRRVQSQGVNAPAASRIYAYAGVALYEAVVNGMPANYSLSGQLVDMPDMPLPQASDVYDWPAVANGALAKVIAGSFNAPSEETLAAIAELRQQQFDARVEEVGEDIAMRSNEYGSKIGDALLGWISQDGYAETLELDAEYELPTGSDLSLYTLTAEGSRPIGPYWGTLRPFGLFYAEVCHVPLNMPFDSDLDSAFYAQANEVFEVGNNLTSEQQEIARFWFDPPNQTGLPAGHWVAIENQMVEQRDLNLEQTAGMYSLVGMALADSFISAWSLKYEVMLLRPETYIREYIRESWQPYIQTPPFPEYPSGHSVTSAAAAEVLTSLFGIVHFTDRTHVTYDHEPLVREFTSFEAAASEAAISRLYGGIHYRVAIENGMRQGRCVGQQVLENVQLGPIPQGE
jgi:membrane-associated phospholipid phosphatase